MELSPNPTVEQQQRPNSDEIDRLSHLPDELLLAILSLLPTHLAARTSLLSRRFRRLWEASPSLDLVLRDVPRREPRSFVRMADRLFLRRGASHPPLLSLRLGFPTWDSFGIPVFTVFLRRVCSFNLRHLAVEFRGFKHYFNALPDIFAMASLESLSLAHIAPEVSYPLHMLSITNDDYVSPSAIRLTRLRTLSVGLDSVNPGQFHRLVSELCSLEELHVVVRVMEELNISSNTIRKLKLVVDYVPYSPKLNAVTLCLPSLDLLCVERKNHRRLPRFLGKIPNLRKADLTLDCVGKENCGVVASLIDCVSNVEELILDIKEDQFEKDAFRILLEPGKEAPYFPNMKHLVATMAFHTYNFEDIVSILDHSPAPESVKLVHEVDLLTYWRRADRRKKIYWKSMLPRNADRNYRYAYFRNLHLGVNKKKFMNAMSKKCTSKRQALE